MGVCTSKANRKEITSLDSEPEKKVPTLPEYEFDDYRLNLINAYIHDIQTLIKTENDVSFISEYYIFTIIPPLINKLIHSYYPLFQIYGIGANFSGLWESGKNLVKFTKLEQYEQILSDPNNLYHGNYCYFILNNIHDHTKTKKTEIYGIGRNIYNELCLNSAYNYPFVDKFQKIESFYNCLESMDQNQEIEYVAHGIYGYTSKVTAFKLKNGSIYLSDNSYISHHRKNYSSSKSKLLDTEYNELYNFQSSKLFTSFHKLSPNLFLKQDNNIIQIECGIAHLLFLSSSGRVYGIGNNNYCQLGFPFNQQNRYKKWSQPVIIEKLVENHCHISYINCGKNHNVVVDENENKIWCFGDNTFRQCINKEVGVVMEPEIYPFDGDIIKAECGMDFTCFIDNEGNCYGFGDFIFDLKGINHDSICVCLSEHGVLFKDFSVGNKHILLISLDEDDGDNKIYSFGVNTCNQCGFDHDTDKVSDVMELKKELFPGLEKSNVRRVIAALNQTVIIYD